VIVSVHIPKTAGTSFGSNLAQVFGPRLLSDYDDWPESATPEAVDHNERNRAAMLATTAAIGERYDAIHGHFVATKYAGVFPATALVTFVRDPYQHAVSTYEHATRTDDSPHPGFRLFKEARMTLLDFIEAFPNHQSLYLRGVPIDDLAMIGLAERYEQSVALFEAMFDISMPHGTRQNVNPAKHGAEYEITPEVRRAVERSRAEDIALHRQARERFAQLSSKYGV
jgi:Sulfotransferase family